MRLNKSIERYIDHIDRSRLWLQVIATTAWLAGAGVSCFWMVYGGGVVRPLASFAVWAAGVCFVTVRGIDRTTDRTPTLSEIGRALRYGGYSVAGLALGTLFCEYWPVTMSMAFMFAICRSFHENDAPAYV